MRPPKGQMSFSSFSYDPNRDNFPATTSAASLTTGESNASPDEVEEDDDWISGTISSAQKRRNTALSKATKARARKDKKKGGRLAEDSEDEDEDEDDDYDDNDEGEDDFEGESEGNDSESVRTLPSDEDIQTPVSKKQRVEEPSSRASNASSMVIQDSDDEMDPLTFAKSKAGRQSTPYYGIGTSTLVDEEQENGAEVKLKGKSRGLLRKRGASVQSEKPRSRLESVSVDPVLDSGSKAKKARIANERAARASGRTAREPVVLDDSDDESATALGDNGTDDGEEVKDKDQDDDDDEDETRYAQESRSKTQLQDAAKQIMLQCQTYSDTLRKAIARMMTKDEGRGNVAEDDIADDNALAVTALKKDSQEGMITQALVDQFCDPECLLKNYQMVGVNWIKLLHQNRLNGVLADDMGLGKTVQTIAFLGWLKHMNVQGTHLIVVPASTLSNWEKELERFCPRLQVKKYHGTQDERYYFRQDIRQQGGWGCDVVLTTYTIFERESNEKDRVFLFKRDFHYLILDEAHALKNANSQRFINLNAVVSRRRLLLSGTPVQNNLTELLSILSFLMPDVFRQAKCELLMEAYGWHSGGGSANDVTSINLLRKMLVPFVLRRMKVHVLDQLVKKVTETSKVEMTESQKRVYDGVLFGYAERKRRLQIELEERKKHGNRELDVGIGTSSSQFSGKSDGGLSGRGSRRSAAAAAAAAAADSMDSSTPPISREASSGSLASHAEDTAVVVDLVAHSPQKVTQQDLIAAAADVQELSAKEAKSIFTALRKAANHPLMLRVRFTDDALLHRISQVCLIHQHFGKHCDDLQRVRAEIESFSDFDLHQVCMEYKELDKYTLERDALYDSPKFAKLRQMLPGLVSSGNHLLVFSQWTRTLDLLELLMDDLELLYLRLDGSTAVKERQALIDQFNSGDIPIFLLSTKAGGLGINLCQANYVILHDLDFNPENDRQAEDRAHRIGQTRQVHVVKMVTAGTVDEDIHDMGERKKKLSEAILRDSSDCDGEKGKEKKKKKKKNGEKNEGEGGEEEEEEDVGAIGQILQRALLKRTGAQGHTVGEKSSLELLQARRGDGGEMMERKVGEMKTPKLEQNSPRAQKSSPTGKIRHISQSKDKVERPVISLLDSDSD